MPVASVPQNLFAAIRQHVDAVVFLVKIHVFAITIIIVVDKVIETKVFHFDHFAFEHFVSFGGTFRFHLLFSKAITKAVLENLQLNMHFSYYFYNLATNLSYFHHISVNLSLKRVNFSFFLSFFIIRIKIATSGTTFYTV